MSPAQEKLLLHAKEMAKLPVGLACRVRYAGQVIDIPEGKDPFDVCNAVHVKVFGCAPLERDARFDALMERGKA